MSSPPMPSDPVRLTEAWRAVCRSLLDLEDMQKEALAEIEAGEVVAGALPWTPQREAIRSRMFDACAELLGNVKTARRELREMGQKLDELAESLPFLQLRELGKRE
jgi:hypothetical protein